MPSAQLFILVSLQRSGTTWFVEEMAKSPCVRAEHEIFDGFEGKVHGVARSDDAEQWTPAGRRAALDGLMDLAAGNWEGYHDRVPSKLWAWTNHTRELMNKHNETMAPIAVGLKWMAGHAKGNGHGGKAFEIVDNQGFEASLEWLLPLARARSIKFLFLERGHLLRRAVSSYHNRRAPLAHARRRRPNPCVPPHAIDATSARPTQAWNASMQQRLAHAAPMAMPTGAELLRELDKEQAALSNLLKLRDRVKALASVRNRRVNPHAVAATQAAGIKEKHLKYERLDADNAILDDMRRWILGDLGAEARCAPEAKATTLKVHTGSIADHVSNWGDVCDTLRGTRYEKYLDD